MSTITLYSLAKKTNSTKRPVIATPKLQLTGQFRAPVDVLNPVVLIEIPSGTDLIQDGYNIAHITEFGRYYWINNLIMTSAHMAELHMSVDVLASYKNSIGSSTQYVLRSASSFDGSINDPVYPAISGQECVTEELTNSTVPWYNSQGYSLPDGWYIIGVHNEDTDAIGSVSYYCLNDVAFQSLRHTLFQGTGWTNMTFADIEEPLYKSIFNPLQYITSVKWFPLKPDISDATNVTFLDLGFFPSIPVFSKTGSYAYRLGSKGFTAKGSATLTLQKHPQAAARGEYLNLPPFFYRTLYIEPFGSIDLDGSKMYGAAMQPVFNWYLDFITGDCRARITVSGNDDAIVGESCAKLGVDVSLAQINQGDAASMLTSGAVGKIYNFIEPAFKDDSKLLGAMRLYGNTLAAPNLSTLGTPGSLISGNVPPIDQTTYNFVAPNDDARLGIPLLQTKTISTLSGFIQTDGAVLEIAGAYAPEIQQICSFMDGGFYYE